MTLPPFPVRRFLAPRYWPVWAGLGATWCLARLPYTWLMRLGRFLGRAMLALPGRRRHIAAVNLSLCFPELTAPRRRELLVKHFESLGMSMLEMALSWWAPPARLYPLAQVEGLEHLNRALAQGRGAILLIAHFTT